MNPLLYCYFRKITTFMFNRFITFFHTEIYSNIIIYQECISYKISEFLNSFENDVKNSLLFLIKKTICIV